MLPAFIAAVLAFLADEAQRRHATWSDPTGLSDSDLWALVVTGRDPLAGMSLLDAARLDPRRIDASIRQAIYLGMHAGFPQDQVSEALNRGTYLLVLDGVRRASGGMAPAGAVLGAHEQSWYQVLSAVLPTWPPEVRQELLARWEGVQAGFDRARQLARHASAASRAQGLEQEAGSWERMRRELTTMEQWLGQAVVEGELPALPGASAPGIEVHA